jgi:glycerol uptake facilitator-like aquaporin
MYYFLLIIFLSLISYIAIGDSALHKVTFKTNPKYRKYVLDAIVCFLGGIFFSISVKMFAVDTLRLGYEYFDYRDWRLGRTNNLGPFIFGFIITYIIIFIRRAYRK